MKNPSLQGHQVVCSAFIVKDNKILIVMDPKFKVWRVPGGRPEHGKVLEDTLLREIKEETGIAFKNPKFLGLSQDRQYKVIGDKETSRVILYFLLKLNNEDVKLDHEEAEDFRWVSLDKLKKIDNKEGDLDNLFLRSPDISI